MAASRSGAWMIQKPPRYSFVSENGPSVMIAWLPRPSTTVADSMPSRPPANTQAPASRTLALNSSTCLNMRCISSSEKFAISSGVGTQQCVRVLGFGSDRDLGDHLASGDGQVAAGELGRLEHQPGRAGGGRGARDRAECGRPGVLVEQSLARADDDREHQQPIDVDQAGVVQGLHELPAAVHLQLSTRLPLD